jgi:ribosomal protein RSM22 (predicted rRNA methylase)
MELPPELRTAIETEIVSLPSNRLSTLAADLSKRYRAGPLSPQGRLLRSREDIAAYAAFRLPATFAAVGAALTQVKEGLPGWRPRTLLDVGAGPGTGMWAAAAVWPDLERVTLLEREDGMIDLGKRLAAYSSLPSVREATWLKADITAAWEAPPHDLVIAAYVLGELPGEPAHPLIPPTTRLFIRTLWEHTSGVLVIVEPGTPAGFSRVRKARDQLLDAGAKSVAPCPHDRPCPMPDDDWCHFAQRVARARLHRQVKKGELGYEDEKFSFVAVFRMTGDATQRRAPSTQGRVIRHPQVRAGHIRLELCTPGGLTSTVITRKDREAFRIARGLRWGSAVTSNHGGYV